MRIEIHHPDGHVTTSVVRLSNAREMIQRIEEDEKCLAGLMENINPQLLKGTKVYLIIESKANGKDT